MMNEICVGRWISPVGEMILGENGGRVCLCDWAANRRRVATDRRICLELGARYVERPSEALERLREQLGEYFAGERREFGLPLRFVGTDFQCRVWAELLKIPYGATMTYGDLARRLGRPKAVRAVAAAVGANPISILVPCHRIVGRDGSLTGYAGGLDAKRILLEREGPSTFDASFA